MSLDNLLNVVLLNVVGQLVGCRGRFESLNYTRDAAKTLESRSCDRLKSGDVVRTVMRVRVGSGCDMQAHIGNLNGILREFRIRRKGKSEECILFPATS